MKRFYIIMLAVAMAVALIVPFVAVPALANGPPACRTIGGGTIGINDPRVTYAFDLHCNHDQLPNMLQVNWAGNSFHLTELTFSECADDPTIEPTPPSAACDIYHGIGLGTYSGEDGYKAEWVFKDAGEPGRNDWAWIRITAPDGSKILEISGFLAFGNQQFLNCTGKDVN